MGWDHAKRQPARDGHRAAGAARQQRTHLRFVQGIVEHDQDPPVGHQAPVQAGTLVQVLWHRTTVDPHRGQEPAQHVVRIERPGVRTAQVHVQLPVREP
jgi:hypothetical protein